MRSRVLQWRRCCAPVVVFALAMLAGCYSGGDREKEPPPGYPGGFCLAPAGTCHEGTCDVAGGAYCFDPTDPCKGVFCGGNGVCLINAEQKPSCECDPGFSNEMYALFCEPGGTSTGVDTGMDTGMTTGAPMPDMGG